MSDTPVTEEVEEKEEAPAEPEKPAFDAEAAYGSLNEKLDKLLEKPKPARRTSKKPGVKLVPTSTKSETSEPETPAADTAAPKKERQHRYGSRRWYGDRSLEPEDS